MWTGMILAAAFGIAMGLLVFLETSGDATPTPPLEPDTDHH